MRIIYVLFFFFSINALFSQVTLPGTIEHVFKSEFLDKSESNDEIGFVTLPQVLPDWFFNPSKGDHENFYAIGISDPWMDINKGKTQARIRAFCLASFMSNVTWKGISDFYTGNAQRSKFEQISRFITTPNNGLKGLIVDSFLTKYQEQAYLYKFNSNNLTKKNNSLIDYYKSEIKHDAGSSEQEKIELFCKSDSDILLYKCTINDTNFEILSVLNADTISIKPTVYRYVMRKNKNDSDSISEISLFKKGLWQGYFKSLIDNLEIAASAIATNQKSVSETNLTENGINSFNQLNRGVFNVSFSFGISSIEFAEKEMIFHFKTNHN